MTKSLIRFGVVGTFSTVIDFALYFFLLGQGLPPPAAKALGYLLGLCSSFLGNTLWSFEQGGAQLRSIVILFKFGLVYALALVANVFVNEITRMFIGGFSVLVALAISIFITFLGLKFFVYQRANGGVA